MAPPCISNWYNLESRNHPDIKDASLIPNVILYHHLNILLSHLFLFIFISIPYVQLPSFFFFPRIFILTILLVYLYLFSSPLISFPYSSQCYFQNANLNHIPFWFKIIHISLFLNSTWYFLTWPSRFHRIWSLPTPSALFTSFFLLPSL